VFSVRGKTDVLLTVPRGGVFIAEAKIWAGPSTVQSATDQILGYLTWRDAFGVVLLFSRNRDFAAVRSATRSAIGSLPSIRGELHEVDEHHWSARQILRDGAEGTAELHYLAYNVAV
jgi:hypothetical protein